MVIHYPYDPRILELLQYEMNNGIKNGFYHYTQVQFAYNSNHMEGSTLTPEQTETIFDKGFVNGKAKVDDILEANNHFRMFDFLIDTIEEPLSVSLIKQIHQILRLGVDEDAGEYKKYQNQIGSINPITTASVRKVSSEMDKLLSQYKGRQTFEDIVEFHYNFEKIHPFQDGNGRTGRAIMFRECIRNQIMPFVVYDNLRQFYSSGLRQWGENNNRQQLLETLNSCQETFFQNYRYFINEEDIIIDSTLHPREFNSYTAPNNDYSIKHNAMFLDDYSLKLDYISPTDDGYSSYSLTLVLSEDEKSRVRDIEMSLFPELANVDEIVKNYLIIVKSGSGNKLELYFDALMNDGSEKRIYHQLSEREIKHINSFLPPEERQQVNDIF